jgi:hypothetical protein
MFASSHGVGCSLLEEGGEGDGEEGEEEDDGDDLEECGERRGRHRDLNKARLWRSYKMAGLILANQAMWVPALVS